MKELIRLSFQQIRRRLSQSAILFSSICLASMLLAIALGMIGFLNKPFDRVFDKLEGSHFLLYFDQRRDNPQAIRNWFQQQKEVEAVSQIKPFVLQNGPFIFRGKKLELSLRLQEHHWQKHEADSVHILEGEEKSAPGLSEIWLSRSFTERHGIELGDSLGVPLGPSVFWLKVSAWVVDPHYASGMVNPGLAWLAPGSLANLFPIDALQEVNLGIRLKHPQNLERLWDRFKGEQDYSGSKLDYHLFRSASGSLMGLISSTLLVVAFLIFLLSVILVRNSLKANIQADFRQIGIWKSLGFTPSEIQFIYIFQVLLLAVLAICLGICTAYFLLPLFFQNSISNFGIIQLELNLLPFCLAGISCLLMIFFFAWMGSRKAALVPAAQAIKVGRPEKRQHFHLFSFQKLIKAELYFTAFLLQSRPFRNLMLIVSLALCLALMSVLLHLGNSFSQLEKNPAAWGFEDVDLVLKKSEQVLISRRQHEILYMLSKEDAVENIIPYNWLSLSIPPQRGHSGRELMGKVYVLPNLEEAGLLNLEGRHPQNANEISLCIGTANQYGIGLGDSLWVELEGEKIKLKLCGLYQDIGNMGQGFRMHVSAVKKFNPLFEVSLFGLQLKRGWDKNELKVQLLQTYGEIFEFERGIGEIIRDMGILSGIWAFVQLLCAFFLLVISLLVFFDLGLLFREESGHFDLLHALGMGDRELSNILLFRIGMIVLLAGLLGLSTGAYAGGFLISQITHTLGLAQFPYHPDFLLSLLLLFIVILLTLLLSFFKGRSISLSHAKLPSIH